MKKSALTPKNHSHLTDVYPSEGASQKMQVSSVSTKLLALAGIIFVVFFGLFLYGIVIL